jgi:hypothetical protein
MCVFKTSCKTAIKLLKSPLPHCVFTPFDDRISLAIIMQLFDVHGGGNFLKTLPQNEHRIQGMESQHWGRSQPLRAFDVRAAKCFDTPPERATGPGSCLASK